MSSGSVVSLSSFNLLFFTQVLTVLTSTVKYNEYVTDKGKNISIPCEADGTIMWVKENDNNPTIIQAGKILVLRNISESDGGIYICFASVPAAISSEEKPTDAEKPDENKISEKGATDTNSRAQENTRTLSRNNTEATAATTTIIAPPTTATATAIAKELTPALTTSLPKPTTRPISSLAEFFPFDALTNSTNQQIEQEEEYVAFQKINLSVRTPPGPVTQLYFKASTILGFLIWRFNKTLSGGYPVRSFTAEFRNVSYSEQPYNSSLEHEWSRMDPINIAPNVRQMEVYRLEPNTTYEFRIWANNQLGSGTVVTTNVTTLPETKEEDLIRLIQPDLDNFDPRIWIVAVSIVLGTLVILAIGLCIVLSKECYQASHKGYEDGWDSIELIPNIILNPGFCESDGRDAPYTRTVIFGEDDDSDGYASSESDHEPRMEKFKRKVSVFFTGPTIKRM